MSKAKTGSHLKIERFGSDVQGVQLFGDKRRPEHDEFRVIFPGGYLSVTRTSDGDYWAHIGVDHPDSPNPRLPDEDLINAKIVDARADVIGKHSSKTTCGDGEDPLCYHIAVRIAVV